MKAESVQGYVIALSFLNMYEDDGNKMSDTQKQVQFELSKIVSVYARKHDVKKWVDKAWNRFITIAGKENIVVDALVFALQLIVKNPNIEKNNRLRSKAMEASKMFSFKKEEAIKNSKVVVNKFYNLGE